jgi:hypothetical protein
VEENEKHEDEQDKNEIQQICPEVEASFLSKLTYWW